MKNTTILAVTAAAILMAGCGKKETLASNSNTPSSVQTSPISQPALTAWQQGDKAAAISNFVAADWSARPLFAADSPLSLSEDQFKSLSDADRKTKSKVMLAQIDSFKTLAAAVIQAGHDAAAKGDAAEARKDFTALKACGAALGGPESLKLVQLVGEALNKNADTELAKIPQ